MSTTQNIDNLRPLNQVKFNKEGNWVDSTLNIIPYSSTDSLRFLTVNSLDTTDLILQRKVFSNPRVYSFTNTKIEAVRFWFTQLISSTDKTKTLTFFSVLRKGNTIEHARFRFDKKGNLIGINAIPSMSEEYISPKQWTADTIPIEHDI